MISVLYMRDVLELLLKRPDGGRQERRVDERW
jgi:hypothetical protein